jgi:ferredoxin
MASETLYRRLQQHLDRMPVGFPPTESGVEIRILEQLYTPEEAGIAIELSVIPEPAAAIHKRLQSDFSLAELTEKLEIMGERGVILRLSGKHGPLYGKIMFVVGSFERQLPRLTAQFARDVDQYMKEAFGRAFHTTGTTQMRTVPIHKSIPIERNVATHEDIRAYIESSPGPFAAQKCICREAKHLLGEKCRQTSLRESCLMIGAAAVEMVRAGSARYVSREEMLDLLEQADKEGLVLQPENTLRPLFVCCCCGCCCGVLTSAKRFPEPADYFSASFYAEVDAALCQSCGSCETRCQMDAISNVDGAARVDRGRCIGCALCVTTCPSGALRLEQKESPKIPPSDTRALYLKMLQERYGPWGMAKLAGRKMIGMKF